MAPRKKATASAKPRAKAAPKPKPPAKKATESKTSRAPKAKLPMRRLTPSPEPETPPKRRKLDHQNAPITPEWDKGIRSQSQRNKSAFQLSRASLYDDSINEKSIDDLFQKLDPGSLSKITWGVPISSPIKATNGKVKAKTVRRRTANGANATIEENWAEMMQDMRDGGLKIKPNNPDRSPILRLSLEVREKVYGYLLTYRNPILIRPDWQTVESIPRINHSIRRVCKQFYHEATTVLYQGNVFQAVFRKQSRTFSFYDQAPEFNIQFVSYFRNVVLDFNIDCWDLSWYEKATNSVQVLITAEAVISSLSLVVAPKRVGVSNTALGKESNPVTFADFVWHDGDFMASLRELAPRQLKVVIRKGATKKLTISVDLKYLNARYKQQSHLVNPVTWKILKEREGALSKRLRCLKDAFEEIFEYDEWATRRGECTSNEPLPVEIPEVLEEVAEKVELLQEQDTKDNPAICFAEDPLDICTDFGGSDNSDDDGSRDEVELG